MFKTKLYLSSGLIFKSDMLKLKWLEFLGIIFISITSTLLTFSYKYSNGATWSIIIGSSNNSNWELVKTFILPYAFWIFIEISISIPPFKTFIVLKTINLYFCLTLISIALSASNHLSIKQRTAVYIILLFLTLTISSFVLCKLITLNYKTHKLFKFSLIASILLIVCYILFTFFPLQFDFFKDPLTGTYGFPKTTVPYHNYINARNV